MQPTIADFFTTITFCRGGSPKPSLYSSFVLPLFPGETGLSSAVRLVNRSLLHAGVPPRVSVFNRGSHLMERTPRAEGKHRRNSTMDPFGKWPGN